MENDTIDRLLKDTQKKYHLSKNELARLESLLEYHHDALPDWELMVGLTPSQIASQIAKEFCKKFPGPVLVHQQNDSKMELKTELMLTPKSFITILGPRRSWRKLEDGLRKLSRIFSYGPEYDFCERKVFAIYATLRRNDVYGVRGDSQLPEKSAKRRAAKKRIARMEINGVEQKIEFPEFDGVQCRHCWRYVLVDPKRVTRKAPLCALHQYHSQDKEYKARQRLVAAYQLKEVELRKQIRAQYEKQRNTGQDVQFLLDLAISPDSPFPAFSSYMHSLDLPLESDKDLLRAFNYIESEKLSPEYEKRVDDWIEFLLNWHSGVPVPLTIFDCINAEAWLQVGRRCKYK